MITRDFRYKRSSLIMRIFNIDSKVIRFGNKVTDLMILQVLTIVFSLPIITIGPTFTAMHHVLLKMYRKQDPSVVSTFWAAFKSNFKQATLMWLFYLGFFLILIADLWFFVTAEDVLWRLAIYVLPILALLGLMSGCWAFILLSRYENTILNTLRHAFTLLLRYPLKTLSMVVLMALSIWLSYLYRFTIPFLMLLGISVPGFLCTIVYSKIFDTLEGTDWRKEQQITED